MLLSRCSAFFLSGELVVKHKPGETKCARINHLPAFNPRQEPETAHDVVGFSADDLF